MWPDKRLTVVFSLICTHGQNDFYPEFAKSLNLADQVILLDIYPAREQPIQGGDIGFDCRATDGAIRAGDEGRVSGVCEGRT